MSIAEQIRSYAENHPSYVVFAVFFVLGMFGIIAAYSVVSNH